MGREKQRGLGWREQLRQPGWSGSRMWRGGHGGLNDLLDGVNLVGSWDWDGTGNGDLIRLGDMLVDNDLTGNGTWDGNWDINVVFLDIDLWDNVGELGSDSGVSS